MPTIKVDPRCRDHAIADLFRRQHGVAARSQLVEAGLYASTLDSRVARGRLVRIHREVYAEGHAPLSRRGQMQAALLAAGPEAVISGESALASDPRTHGDDRSRGILLAGSGLEVVRINAADIQFDRANTADVIQNAMRRTLRG